LLAVAVVAVVFMVLVVVAQAVSAQLQAYLLLRALLTQ
jgi:hypothetical protein